MLKIKGNIWDYHKLNNPIVIPTNIGWKKDGSNVMGAGVARQAAHRFPNLSKIYGQFCQTEDSTALLWIPLMGIYCFPVKPLNEEQPWLSWKNKASLELIDSSADRLQRVASDRNVHLPLVGCGNGGLSREQVLPILERYLDDSFTLVER